MYEYEATCLLGCYLYFLVYGANDEGGGGAEIRYDAGGRGPKVPNAAPTRVLVTRNVSA